MSKAAGTWAAAATLVVFAACCNPAQADSLPRAASVSVCTDQYLLSLAAPEQIAAVSWQAGSRRSPVRHLAGGFTVVRGMAEELLVVGAELVIFDPYGHPKTADRLEALGTRIFRLSDPITLQDVEVETQRVADALGRHNRGREVVAGMSARRVALETQTTEAQPRALYISPGGGGAGADTYIDAVLRLAGFRNLQAELGSVGWQRVRLEQLIDAPPDVLVLSFFETSDPSLLDGFGRHPLFRRMVRETPIITVPAAPWVCAGPYLLDAAEYLAAERVRLFPDSGASNSGGPGTSAPETGTPETSERETSEREAP